MPEHYCEQVTQDEDTWWGARCKCGFTTQVVPSIDLVVDEMMKHAAIAALTRAGSEPR